MIVQSEISERLAEAIEQSGLPQKEIAAKLQICQQMISSYKNKQKLPSLETFANLCAVLDVDADYILCLKD